MIQIYRMIFSVCPNKFIFYFIWEIENFVISKSRNDRLLSLPLKIGIFMQNDIDLLAFLKLGKKSPCFVKESKITQCCSFYFTCVTNIFAFLSDIFLENNLRVFFFRKLVCSCFHFFLGMRKRLFFETAETRHELLIKTTRK